MVAPKVTKRRRALRVAAAHLDDFELDRVFEFALQGDMAEVEKRLARVAGSGAEVQGFSWRETSSWLFNRKAFPKRGSL